MIVFEFGDDLFHYYLTKKRRLGADFELRAERIDCRFLTVIEIEYLTVLSHESRFLLVEVVGIYRY